MRVRGRGRTSTGFLKGYGMSKASNVLFAFVCLAFSLNAQTNKPATIPHLEKHGTATQLIVDGMPFLMLAGETGNSSASDLKYLDEIWPKIAKMNLNTLLVPIYWELIEPSEGTFNFTLVEGAINGARKHDIRLVFLWFGTWKNSMSCYAPLWVKANQARFPRARDAQGRAHEILTPFSNENLSADKRVFAELMKHIRMVDSDYHTVVMVQVENEIGMIPSARDHSNEAEAFFGQKVPAELLAYLQKNKESLTSELREAWGENGFKSFGSWEEVFGKGLQTDELFMAWYFAKYTNAVAEAGKMEYPLPMYVNAALIRPGYKPGQYPSAGPLPHLFDLWKAAAPAVDFLTPDLYFKNFAEWVIRYDRPGNPLFVPEASNAQGMANAFYAIGQLNAMGYSPFSIESLDHPENNQVTHAYDVLRQLTPLILANQGKGNMVAALLDSANQKAGLKLGDYVFTVSHEYSWPYAARSQEETPRFGCMIIMVSPNEYYIAGRGVIVTFRTAANDGTIAGIGTMDEGGFVDGKWMPGLRMNGDQSHQGRHMNLPGNTFGIQKIQLYRYK
jgi:beta-galactosidase GanA